MKENLIEENILQELLRLLTIDSYLKTLQEKTVKVDKCLIDFFRKEFKYSLKFLEKYYLGISTPAKKVLKKRKNRNQRKERDSDCPLCPPVMPKKSKKGVKGAKTYTKRKNKKGTKKGTKNKKS